MEMIKFVNKLNEALRTEDLNLVENILSNEVQDLAYEYLINYDSGESLLSYEDACELLKEAGYTQALSSFQIGSLHDAYLDYFNDY